MSRKRFLTTIFALAMFVGPRLLQANIIGVAFDFENSPAFSINEATGVGALLGFTGFEGLNSLARNSSGVLFSAADNRVFGDHTSLLTVDAVTGNGTLVSTLNFGAVAPDVRGLAFSAADILFAINNTGPAGGLNPDDLFTINVATGVGTLVGATGLSDLQGLAFSPAGLLYGWDITLGLVTINPATGLATDVNPAVGADALIQTLAFAPDGTLFGARDALFTIDPVTGASAFVGAGGYSDIRGIEFIVQRVPEPSLLLLLGSALAALGLGWRRPGF